MAGLKADSDDDSPLEDEYGYVVPVRASHALLSQLPSRHIENLIDDDEEEEEEEGMRVVHRRKKSSQYKKMKLNNVLKTHHNEVDALKVHRILSCDGEVGYDEKLKMLKEMPISLSLKRQVKERLDADRRQEDTASYSYNICNKRNIRMAFDKFWLCIKNVCYLLEPWNSSIKTIQGNFGSCVSSYFIFLRWLLYLNLFNFFVTFLFVVIPQAVYQWSSSPIDDGNTTSSTFHLKDLFTGMGWLKGSLLYFGSYSSQVIDQPIIPYNMPLAYLSAPCFNMIIILIVLSISITRSYQKNYVDSAGEIKNVFCNKLFSAWDFSIQTESAAALQRRTISNDIKELLYIKRMSERKISLRQTIVQQATFLLISLLTVGVISLVGYATYALLQKGAIRMDAMPVWLQLRFPVILTIISSFSYHFLKYATKLEAYVTPKRKLYLTMIRVVILRSVILGIVIYFWMIIYKPPRNQKVCYETELGGELYRLILMNFLCTVVVFTFVGEFVRKLLHRHIWKRIDIKEFDVAYNTLDLIYFQTLAWLSLFYVPLVSLLTLLMLVVLFYTKKLSLTHNCRSPERSWSIYEMHTFYLTLTFLTFLFSVVTVGYTIFGLEASDCGPFKDFPTAGDALLSIFFEGSVGRVFEDILKYGTSPVVLVVIFCILCLAVHYMRAKANALITVVKKLREDVILSSKDKEFLLQLYDKAVQALNIGTSTKKELNGCGNVVVNEAYTDRSLHTSPLHHPSYMPAEVPVNIRRHHHQQQQESPNCPTPQHQPGFRHILPED